MQFQDDAPPAWLGDWLLAAGAGVDVVGPTEAALDRYDAMVVLGGSPSADDDRPDVRAAQDLVREAAQRRLPTLGICLGHQVAAVALGGTVARNPDGQQVGLTPVGWLDAAAEDPLLGTLTDVRHAVHWNGDVVVELPPSGTLLATASGGRVQAARLAETVWGVQWHPEVDDRVITSWAEEDRAAHPPGRVDTVVAEVRAARAELEQGWRGLATSLLRLTA
ncbi:type 1 glutamine amidotransferase [Nocardioides mangrovicus]|uniref:type 1 glutamine amidotransferase n=1 Tax=Nocardioides mangrovicus TaxID=2478913 RepID=UPI0013141557|nr:type 1 glutamine amidotransferase [Nocardioides mangrovicus]